MWLIWEMWAYTAGYKRISIDDPRDGQKVAVRAADGSFAASSCHILINLDLTVRVSTIQNSGGKQNSNNHGCNAQDESQPYQDHYKEWVQVVSPGSSDHCPRII